MWRKLALLACLTFRAFAQDAISHATPSTWTAELNGNWRWHAGDNLAWAAPKFYDSNWPELKIPGPPPRTSGISWLRLRIRVGTLSKPALLISPIASAYEIYWDGEHLGNFGHTCDQLFVPNWQVFAVPSSEAPPGPHTLALRGCPPNYSGVRPFSLVSTDNWIGEPAAIEYIHTALVARDFRSHLLQLLIEFTILLAGIYFLLLPPSVSQGAAFRWFGAFLISRASNVFNEFYMTYGPPLMSTTSASRFLYLTALFGIVALIEFTYSLFRRRVHKAVRCLEIFFLLAAANSVLGLVSNFLTFKSPILLVSLSIPLFIAADEMRKRSSGAAVFLVTFSVYDAAAFFAIAASVYRLPVPEIFDLRGFSLWPLDAALLLFVLAMAMQIHKTNQRFRDEQERLRGEMEAARQVQEILLPSRKIEVPGFDVDATYHPATEVGGDFFQLFPAANDSLLVVMGDVSGKGMKAALLVSLIVGALQNRKSDRPATVLAELNAVLLGRGEGGFTTCCCALFTSDGAVTIANAGHLAPYRNSQEIDTLPGLPLGVTPEAHWGETSIYLQPGDRILWVSDGVVEARNRDRDLLGFDRAQELTAQPASEIARAAQQFGQEDDITVVSITRQKAAAYVA